MEAGRGAEADVHVRPDAAEYIRERGGQAYIWADDDGLSHVRTEAPLHGGNWTRYEAEGVYVHVDASAGAATAWTVKLRHLPWKGLEIESDLTSFIGPV